MTPQTQSPPAQRTTGAADPIWFASYPPGVPKNIDPDAFPSLPTMLLDTCMRHAARAAFECLDTRMGYAEWERASRAFAAFLVEEAKCRPGERVAIMLPNLIAYPVAFFAVLRAGLIVVNVNPLYTPRELKEQLADSGATVIVIMENFAHKLESVIGETQIRHVVVARLGDFMPALKRTLFNFVIARMQARGAAMALCEFRDAAGGLPPSAGRALCRRQAAGECAGGAAIHRRHHGRAEGRHPHAPQSRRQRPAVPRLDRTESAEGAGSVLTPLPLYHIFSLTANLLAFALMGGLSVLVPDPRDLKRLIRTMGKARVTTMTGVNTLFNALINTPEFAALDFSKLAFAVGGGAAVQSTVAVRWREITGRRTGRGLWPHRGVAGRVHQSGTQSEARHRRPAGLVDRGSDPRRRRQRRAVGESGEICVRGPQVMQGYWQRPDETRLVLAGDGWLHTGDIGAFDARGFLKILDRKKDMVNVSGFKVFPNEVEDVIAQHPGVSKPP